MKQFVTVLDKEFAAFKYLQDFFLKLSVAKVKACVFVSATNKEDHCARNSPRSSLGWRKMCGTAFVAVVQSFLENHQAENYVELVEFLVENYGKMGCRMSLKIHLDKFKENIGGILKRTS